ncbi:MAG: autorepressor SdpR family transcription factor [bacterium]
MSKLSFALVFVPLNHNILLFRYARIVYLLNQHLFMMDTIFKTLSDKNRRRIIQLLKQKEMTVSELLTHFDITQASLSHHLDILKRSDLVLDERRGQFVFYSLNQPVFEESVNMILNLLV